MSSNKSCRLSFRSALNTSSLLVSFSNGTLLYAPKLLNKVHPIVLHDGRADIVYETVTNFRSEHVFGSDLFIEIPADHGIRSLVTITSIQFDCLTDDQEWIRCGDASRMCIKRNLICDKTVNCLNGFDEKNCSKQLLYRDLLTEVRMESFTFTYHSTSSSLYMLFGFFLLNGFFMLFFIVLAICSLGFCFSKMFYRSEMQRGRRNFLRYIRDSSANNDLKNALPSSSSKKIKLNSKKCGRKQRKFSNFPPLIAINENEGLCQENANVEIIPNCQTKLIDDNSSNSRTRSQDSYNQLLKQQSTTVLQRNYPTQEFQTNLASQFQNYSLEVTI